MMPLLNRLTVPPLPVLSEMTGAYGAPGPVILPNAFWVGESWTTELTIEIWPLTLVADMPIAAALMMPPPWFSILIAPAPAENAVTPPACLDVIDDVCRSVALMLP